MQRGVASGAGGEDCVCIEPARCKQKRLRLHRAGSVQTEKIVFASSRLGANGKDRVCIKPARCKQKRLRLRRAGSVQTEKIVFASSRLELPGSRSYAYLRSSRFRVAESMHIYTALASGEQNLCIFTQLSLPGSRIYAYLRSSRFRLSESMYIYVALASWSRIYAYLRSSRFRGAESMHIYTALASQMQRGVASGAGGEAQCNGGLHQARAGKIVFASSRLGANRKDCVCIEPARCKRKRLCLHRVGSLQTETIAFASSRLHLHRAQPVNLSTSRPDNHNPGHQETP